MQLIIDTANTQLSVKNKCFFIQNDQTERLINTARVSSIAITTNCTLNAAVIKMAAEQQIPIYFFDVIGNVKARMCSPYFYNLASLRKKQAYFQDHPKATNWIISQMTQRISLEIQTLKHHADHFLATKDRLIPSIEKVKKTIKELKQYQDKNITECRNEIMGIEGFSSRTYFEALQIILPERYQFKTRTRQPALDYFNATLNYLYGMTYTIVESAVFAKGLDPFIGFLHTEDYLRTALVFDLIEPFRPVIDRLLIELCKQESLQPKHFIEKNPGYWLSKEGKKLIIPAFNEHLFQRFKIDEKMRTLKDHIYHTANDLGNLIDQTIPI